MATHGDSRPLSARRGPTRRSHGSCCDSATDWAEPEQETQHGTTKDASASRGWGRGGALHQRESPV